MQNIIRTGFLIGVCILGIELAGIGMETYAQDCASPLSESAFDNHKKQLERESFEEDRMKMATNFLKQKKCLKVSQIKRVIKLLNFEDNQVAFAKMAYGFAHDPENYQEVISIFTEAPTRKTLSRFINKRK